MKNETLLAEGAGTISQLWEQTLKKVVPEDPFIFYETVKGFQSLSFKEVNAMAYCLASYMLFKGIQKGDRIGIYSVNSQHCIYLDLATHLIGAVTVVIDPAKPLHIVENILKETETKILLVSHPQQYKSVLSVKENLPVLREILTSFQDENALEKDYTTTYESTVEIGKSYWRENNREMKELRESISPDDLCTIAYTSGNSGMLKGVMLSHQNILTVIQSVRTHLAEYCCGEKILSSIPMANIFERVLGYYLPMQEGMRISICNDELNFRNHLKLIKPTALVIHPETLSALCYYIQQKNNSRGWWGRRRFRKALKVGERMRICKEQVIKPSLLLRLKFAAAKRGAFKKVLAETGGRLKFIICAGGKLPKHVYNFFFNMDLPVLEIYGLTELSSVVSMATLKDHDSGKAGRIIPGVKVAIRDLDKGNIIKTADAETEATNSREGEILVKGKAMFQGYWNNEKLTKKSFEDGWFCTGDIGKFDEGMLEIIDKKENRIIVPSGENIYPGPVESALKASPYISGAVLLEEHGKLNLMIFPETEGLRSRPEFKDEDLTSDAIYGEGGNVHTFFQKELIQYIDADIINKIHTVRIYKNPLTGEEKTFTRKMLIGQYGKKRAAAKSVISNQ